MENGNKLFPFSIVGAGRFELPTSWSRTKRSNRAEPRPDLELNQYTKLFEKNQKLKNTGDRIYFINTIFLVSTKFPASRR